MVIISCHDRYGDSYFLNRKLRLRKLFRALLVLLSNATNMLCLTSGPGVSMLCAPPHSMGGEILFLLSLPF